MKYNDETSTKKILAFSLAFVMLFSVFSIGATNAFADDTEKDFTIVIGANLNDPMIAKILENIEKSKKQFSIVQQKSNQEKLLDEQRSIAKEKLEQELERMFKDNEEFTPLAAFNNFIKKVSNDDTKHIFQGLFDYKKNKIDAARDAMHKVLRNGGSLQEARTTYHETAKIPRIDMIQLVKDLNIEVGFSDPDIQKHFDDQGKLPRYEDEEKSSLNFVDLTTKASKTNSSYQNTITKITQNVETVQNTQETSSGEVKNKDDESDEENQDLTIKMLKEEIRLLKEKIKQLEINSNPKIQQAVLDLKTLNSMPYSSTEYFAKWLLDYNPGKSRDNNLIEVKRSAPINALNEPNSYDRSSSFVSLGIGGQITVSFNQPVMNTLKIYEATWGKTTAERAIVEVSSDGKNWNPLFKKGYDNDTKDVHEFSYDLSDIGCIEYVRITDHSTIGDGFDVDAVGATNLCTNPT